MGFQSGLRILNTIFNLFLELMLSFEGISFWLAFLCSCSNGRGAFGGQENEIRVDVAPKRKEQAGICIHLPAPRQVY